MVKLKRTKIEDNRSVDFQDCKLLGFHYFCQVKQYMQVMFIKVEVFKVVTKIELILLTCRAGLP